MSVRRQARPVPKTVTAGGSRYDARDVCVALKRTVTGGRFVFARTGGDGSTQFLTDDGGLVAFVDGGRITLFDGSTFDPKRSSGGMSSGKLSAAIRAAGEYAGGYGTDDADACAYPDECNPADATLCSVIHGLGTEQLEAVFADMMAAGLGTDSLVFAAASTHLRQMGKGDTVDRLAGAATPHRRHKTRGPRHAGSAAYHSNGRGS